MKKSLARVLSVLLFGTIVGACAGKSTGDCCSNEAGLGGAVSSGTGRPL
jgi:hypothetical protein